MKVPMIKVQGRMEDRARARRQFFANAMAKPAKNAAKKRIATGTFSDIP
jgi:hypothetical protein